ncbi:MAG: UpxY family transcription antiterminator [Terriglobales bacterium]
MLGETMAISGSQFGADYRDLHWYAVQTRANHEKRVRQQLDLRVVETYLPVYESLRHWKDRRVRLELPLFPGYLFVRLALCDRLQVLRTPSVVRIVEFGGKAVALPDPEIETLRRGLTHELSVEPYPYLKVGRRVRVTTGPLQGFEGILVRKKNRSRFVISLDLIMRSVAVETDVAELEPIHGSIQSARTFAGT